MTGERRRSGSAARIAAHSVPARVNSAAAVSANSSAIDTL
jgi:hypothetical protein